mgnify:CR=1 FL=1
MRLLLILALLWAEFWSIVAVSRPLGGLATFVLLLLMAAIGSRLIRGQGLRTVANLQLAMQREQLPAAAMLDAAIVVVAGMLLIFPGFVSDACALVLIFSGIRRRLAARVEAHMARQYPGRARAYVIDGEFYTVREGEEPPPREPLDHER